MLSREDLGQQDLQLETGTPEDNTHDNTGQWKELDLDNVRGLLKVPPIQYMPTSGTSGRQYTAIWLAQHPICDFTALHTNGDHSPTDEVRGVAPLRKREYM